MNKGKAIGLSLALVALAGCSAFDFKTEEGLTRQKVITGLMIVDGLQTVSIGKSECLREVNPVAAAAFGGDEGFSTGRVAVVTVGTSIGSWLLAAWLDRKGGMAGKIYQWLTIGGHGIAVGSNARRGIGLAEEMACE